MGTAEEIGYGMMGSGHDMKRLESNEWKWARLKRLTSGEGLWAPLKRLAFQRGALGYG